MAEYGHSRSSGAPTNYVITRQHNLTLLNFIDSDRYTIKCFQRYRTKKATQAYQKSSERVRKFVEAVRQPHANQITHAGR